MLHRRFDNNPIELARAMRGFSTGRQPSLWAHLDTFQMPVHLIAGALDTKFAELYRRMHERFPDSTVSILPDTGHNVHLENFDAYIATLQAWL